mmetsp:Transcript_31249/g.53374  ORF Transcript_31249/g.53374 Transcript_31249/m.53374 type:complete len:215 (+) Transcript_31249:2-646(+)
MEPSPNLVVSKSKGKSKKKQKQKRNRAKQQKHVQNVSSKNGAQDHESDINTTTDGESTSAIWTVLKDEPQRELDSVLPSTNSSPFITLQDGIVISKSQQSEYVASIQPDHSSLEDTSSDMAVNSSGSKKPTTLKSIFESTTSSIISSSAAADGDSVTAIMESLCLDPSMLLLSPHGMAMEMSPCQLDAIESILKHQLNATKEAQKIQSRLLDKT